MFDVDTKNEDVLKAVKELCGEYYLETFETKNGYHVVANKKFDANGLLRLVQNGYTNTDVEKLKLTSLALFHNDTVEVKANSLVLVAMAN